MFCSFKLYVDFNYHLMPGEPAEVAAVSADPLPRRSSLSGPQGVFCALPALQLCPSAVGWLFLPSLACFAFDDYTGQSCCVTDRPSIGGGGSFCNLELCAPAPCCAAHRGRSTVTMWLSSAAASISPSQSQVFSVLSLCFLLPQQTEGHFISFLRDLFSF